MEVERFPILSSWASVPGTLTPKAKAKAKSLTGDARGYYWGLSSFCSKY